jgi:hypothetical protein
MRLTLRTLLAYLDDALDPALTRQIGEKVAESETARDLIERIKKVTRRRRLTTPEMVGDPEVAVDPNLVADYLDNALSEEQITELERLCLESDVNLAEVAACHQILAVILSEPAQVPPTAYERMYGLVAGAEAIPHRSALPRRREHDAVLDTHDESDEPLLMGMSRPSSSRRWLVPSIAALLLVGLFTVLYFALVGRGFSPRVPATPSEPSDLVREPVRPADVPHPVVAESVPPAPTGPMWAGWLGTPARPVPEQAGPSVASVTLAAGWLAARPGMLGNWFMIFGPAEEGAQETPPAPPPVKPDSAAPPPIRPPNNAQVRIGIHGSPAMKDSLLFRRAEEDDWRLVRSGAVLQSNEEFLTLPGYRSELALDNQMRVELVGSLPLTTPNWHLETSVTLHASAEVDLDLKLNRGRVLITNKPTSDARIRVRFLDQMWEIRLLQPKSEIGFELSGRVPPGDAPWNPHFLLSAYTRGGDVEIRRGGKVQRTEGVKRFVWDNSGRAAPELPISLPEAPAWMTKKTLPDDVRAATTRFATRLGEKLKVGGNEVGWVRVACQESLEETKPWERALAVFCLGAVDQVELLVKELDTDARADIRVRTLDALFHWLGRQPGQDVPLRAALQKREFSAADQEMLVRLLRGFKETGRPTIEMLVNNLNSERLAIRELSYFSLHLALQLQADKLAGYDPAAPAEAREAAIRTIRTRILGKS